MKIELTTRQLNLTVMALMTAAESAWARADQADRRLNLTGAGHQAFIRQLRRRSDNYLDALRAFDPHAHFTPDGRISLVRAGDDQ